MLTVEERAEEVFRTLGLETESSAASGRYRRSPEIDEGISYWSTSFDRQKTDVFGVQFTGAGLAIAQSLEPKFRNCGYDVRNPGTPRVTFCKSVSRGRDGEVDRLALHELKSEVDALLGAESHGHGNGERNKSFVEFMQSSPFSGVDIDTGGRSTDLRDDVL